MLADAFVEDRGTNPDPEMAHKPLVSESMVKSTSPRRLASSADAHATER